MAQTRRDYIQTTEILHQFIVQDRFPVGAIDHLLDAFADMFEQNNPTGFNRDVFIRNCWNGVDPAAKIQRHTESRDSWGRGFALPNAPNEIGGRYSQCCGATEDGTRPDICPACGEHTGWDENI